MALMEDELVLCQMSLLYAITLLCIEDSHDTDGYEISGKMSSRS